jgi:hypothetical protein
MHHSLWVEGIQAWGWVDVDKPHEVHLPSFNFVSRESAVNSMREGWVLAKIQFHKGKWEIIKFYDDPPKIPARVDPWKKYQIEGRGARLQKLSPKALRVKDDK